jgi:hypothetical protein
MEVCGDRLRPGVENGYASRAVVTATMARFHSMGTMAHDDLVCPPSVSARGHPTRGLAVYAFHPQPSRRRRSACGARSGYLLLTVRRWVLKFGPLFARELRRRRPRPTSRWHLDEMAGSRAGSSGLGARLTTKARFSTCSCNGGAIKLQR